MLESHFQLQRRPFSSVPTPDQYFPATSIEAARTALVRLIERQEGPAIVVGSVGTGKSLLCLTLAESFRHLCRVLVLPCGRLCTRRALLQTILYELGLPYRDMEEGELRLYLIDHLSNKSVCPTGILLLVDEADNLSMALLDELRALTNLTSDGQVCVRLVLFGGPRLEERFAHPRLESFNQRLAGRFYLEPFLREETIQYIVQQFLESGGDPKSVFRDSGLEAIHQATGGIPRLVNQLTDHSMILVAIGQHDMVDRDCVETAWADLQQLPLPNRRHDFAQRPTSNIVEFGDLRDEADDEVERTERRLNDIERHLDQFDSDGRLREQDSEELSDFFGESTSVDDEPEVTLYFHSAHDPFGDEFEEEELVVDEFIDAEPRYESVERPLAWRPTVPSPPHTPKVSDTASTAPSPAPTTTPESVPAVAKPAAASSSDVSDPVPTSTSASLESPSEPAENALTLSSSSATPTTPVSLPASPSMPQSTNLTVELAASLSNSAISAAPSVALPKLEVAPPPAVASQPAPEKRVQNTSSPAGDTNSAEAILRSLAASQYIVEPEYQRHARERVSGAARNASPAQTPTVPAAPAVTAETGKPSSSVSLPTTEKDELAEAAATEGPAASSVASSANGGTSPSPWNVDAFVARTSEASQESTTEAPTSEATSEVESVNDTPMSLPPVAPLVAEETVIESAPRPADSRGHNYRQLFSQLRTNRL